MKNPDLKNCQQCVYKNGPICSRTKEFVPRKARKDRTTPATLCLEFKRKEA